MLGKGRIGRCATVHRWSRAPGLPLPVRSTEYPCQLESGDVESGHCRLVKQSKWSVGASDSVWLKAKAKGMGKEVIGAIVTGQQRQAFPLFSRVP